LGILKLCINVTENPDPTVAWGRKDTYCFFWWKAKSLFLNSLCKANDRVWSTVHSRTTSVPSYYERKWFGIWPYDFSTRKGLPRSFWSTVKKTPNYRAVMTLLPLVSKASRDQLRCGKNLNKDTSRVSFKITHIVLEQIVGIYDRETDQLKKVYKTSW